MIDVVERRLGEVEVHFDLLSEGIEKNVANAFRGAEECEPREGEDQDLDTYE